MSYTELYYITQTKQVRFYEEFRNSFRGAMLIWSNMWQKYFQNRIQELKVLTGFDFKCPVEDSDYKLIWGLWKRKDIPDYERAILGSTFDAVILDKEHFARFYHDADMYASEYDGGTLMQQAQAIKALGVTKRNILGIMWNQTSVNDGKYHIKKWIKEKSIWSLYKELEATDERV